MHHCNLFPLTQSDSFWLSLWLTLAHSGSLWLCRSLIGSQCPCSAFHVVETVYPSLPVTLTLTKTKRGVRMKTKARAGTKARTGIKTKTKKGVKMKTRTKLREPSHWQRNRLGQGRAGGEPLHWSSIYPIHLSFKFSLGQ